MFTNELPSDQVVLQPGSTTTPPRVLKQGFTAKEREIFYRLLVDLFVDNPKRKQSQAKEGKENDESI